MRILRGKKSIIINILLGLYLLGHGAISHAAATLNESTGTLFIPAVDVDRGAGAYSVTLQLAGTPALPKIGDEFTVQGATPNATLGLRNVTYTSSNGLAYFPEILVTNAQGTFNYRMLLQYIPESNPFRLKVISLAQNGSATYDLGTGELHIPMVNINHNPSSG